METKAQLLVVDDEDVVLLSVRKALKKDGYDIDSVDSADKALKLLNQKQYDVMITDLMMPGMDGMQLLDVVKNTHPDLRVVMVTGFATMATAMKAIRQGAFDFIAKPFTKSELGSAVLRAVRHGPMESKGETGPVTEVISPLQGLADPSNLFTLRGITWALILFDGKVKIGIEDEFIQTIGEIFSVEIPEKSDHVTQGNPCARITAGDARVHNLWSPMSGRITQLNERAIKEPAIIANDPRGEGWLMIIDPTNIEFEVENLSLDTPKSVNK